MRPDLYFKGSPVRAEAEPQYRRLLEWRDHRTKGGGKIKVKIIYNFVKHFYIVLVLKLPAMSGPMLVKRCSSEVDNPPYQMLC